MTQPLIAAAASLCREFSDTYDQGEPADEFVKAWQAAYGVYESLLAQCPSCDTDDPGNPPPP